MCVRVRGFTRAGLVAPEWIQASSAISGVCLVVLTDNPALLRECTQLQRIAPWHASKPTTPIFNTNRIDEFARRHQRLMQMAEILEDQDHDD